MTRYIRYELKNMEPLRIADDSTSQSGQTNTLKYIPGTTIRGYVINKLSKQSNFEEIKSRLFSDRVRFMNAFPIDGEKELMPPLKGFYEDKKPPKEDGLKELENVVENGQFSDGMKRASLGSACWLEDGVIHYYHVDTSSDLKIKIRLKKGEKQNVFRNEYMTVGKTFAGYIAVDGEQEDLLKRIKDSLEETVVLGNAKSSGMGKCRVLQKDIIEEISLPSILSIPDEGASDELYMVLLSHTVMRDENGCYCGLNLKALEEKLGVSELRIAYCSTSTVNVRGYNATLHLKNPSVTMYEQGSVFHLTFNGTAKKEPLEKLMEQGVGVRRNEGFGQVRFLFGYEHLKWKAEADFIKRDNELCAEAFCDQETLRIVARNYYKRLLEKNMNQIIVSLKSDSLSNSQIGTVRAILLANRSNPEEAKKAINKFFHHRDEKDARQKIHKERSNISSLKEQILQMLSIPLAETLGVKQETVMGLHVKQLLSEEELELMKIQCILNMMRYHNRKNNRKEG